MREPGEKLHLTDEEVWNDGQTKIIKRTYITSAWSEYRLEGGSWTIFKNHFREPLFITRENKLNNLLNK
jgi:hypothetical protein